jgi:hypothetical protein
MTCRQLPHGETGCATSLETNLQCEWNLAESTSRRSEDDVRIERERNERADTFALHVETGSAMGERTVHTDRGHTTAFTIAVRSAQIVTPVTYITSRVSDHSANTGGFRAKGRTIRRIFYVRSLDYLAIWGEKSRSDAEFRIRRV